MKLEITLKAWAAARFDPPPPVRTLRKWARDCRIYPVPQKYGREYRVRSDARYIGRNYENIDGAETT